MNLPVKPVYGFSLSDFVPVVLIPARLCGSDALLAVFQGTSAFQASVNDDGLIVAWLERSDLQENVTAYAAQLTGEPRLILAQFANSSEPLLFNASFHGLCYTVGLLVKLGQSWSRPVKTVSLLTSKRRRSSLFVFEGLFSK